MICAVGEQSLAKTDNSPNSPKFSPSNFSSFTVYCICFGVCKVKSTKFYSTDLNFEDPQNGIASKIFCFMATTWQYNHAYTSTYIQTIASGTNKE